MGTWESNITINSTNSKPFEVIEHKRDPWPIPKLEDRELYHPGDDENYWLYGRQQADDLQKRYTLSKGMRVLDLGCSTGRVARHLISGGVEVVGCDINYRHVRWCNRYLPMQAVQITSIPHLPFPDKYFDCVYALSVFTHIEALDTMWIAELRRVCRGYIHITAHTEHTKKHLHEDHIVYKYVHLHPNWHTGPMTEDKVIYRTADQAYNCHVFYHTRYIKENWQPLEIEHLFPNQQDVVLL